MKNIKIISAGAGSGKTHRLTEEMVALLENENSGVRPNGIIATTFTNKAAAELQERVRVKLLEKGMADKANELTNALIGTVHGLGVKLLKRFAFEAGVSPEVDIIAQEDQQALFNKSLAAILTPERIIAIQTSSERLGMTDESADQWRKLVKDLTDVARTNDFSIAVLEKSKQLSFETFLPFLGKPSVNSAAFFNEKLMRLLSDAVEALDAATDDTKVTLGAKNNLRTILKTLQLRGELNWQDWVKIAKTKVGAKSRSHVEELIEFAETHDEHPQFHTDIRGFIEQIFDISIAALEEYDHYKKQRGLIDYVDMETLVKRLLDHPEVKEVLRAEIDLLMVDEFQDTSPIQLDMFLKLSALVPHSIWVGDPKQSIYGFRGADPALMQEIIKVNAIKKENILEHSWRSREDIVNLTNALFVKAFPEMLPEHVMLRPQRLKAGNPKVARFEKPESIRLGDAIQHWHFEFGEGRMPGKPWMENCLANSIQVNLLESNFQIAAEEGDTTRAIRPGDIAVLCRSNKTCQEVADALHRAGLKAAIARTGLLNTAEARLILACLKFILHPSDSLSIAEILLLASAQKTEDIIEDRLLYLKAFGALPVWEERWAEQEHYIRRLSELREEARDLSGAEMLNLLLEELDLRRIITSWGKTEQRMANVDMLRHYALQYEDACTRLHSAASLGGFLLWLNDLEAKGLDQQGSGEGPYAVNVLTYHKSKGLEWPAVICYDLESSARENSYGLKIVPESPEVDLNNLLGNRWLRFWVNPYGNQRQNTRLEERLQESTAFAEAKKEGLAEDTRLLYVGITRARDYLIFPTRDSSTKWLNRVWHLGQEDHMTLDKQDSETPWIWEDRVITKNTLVEAFERDFAQVDMEAEELVYLEARKGMHLFPPYHIDLKKEAGQSTLSFQHTIAFSSPWELAEADKQEALTSMLHAMLLGDHPDLADDHRQRMAARLIQRFDLGEVITTADLQEYSRSFYQQLQSTWAPTQIIKQYPIQQYVDGRRLDGVIDVLLTTKSGIVVLQLESGSGKGKVAKETVALVQHAKRAVGERFGQLVTDLAVVFVVSGEWRSL